MTELSQAFLIYHMPATSYRAILDALPEHRLRHAYVDHTLEMVSGDYWRERITKVIGRFIETLVFQLDIAITSFGSSVLWDGLFACGFEPDASYYFSHMRVLGNHQADSADNKPPDLILDIYGDDGRAP